MRVRDRLKYSRERVCFLYLFSVKESETKSLSLRLEVALGLCDRCYADTKVGALLAGAATVDIRNRVSPAYFVISRHLLSCMNQESILRGMLASDWF